ncbi:MAG TPA: pentapeptide repeat-containing protein [Candidatus Angelobacter sp.]
MITRRHRIRPRPWSEQRAALKHPWMLPLMALEWPFQWLAFVLGNWAFLELLGYLSTFSVLVAVIFYFREADNRLKQKHYQAWQVINTAQGKGGSGGRIEALQELDADGVSLVGVNVSGAFLQGAQMPNAHLRRSDFSSADVRNSNFQSADFADANLDSANFRESSLRGASFQGAHLDEADLFGADLSGADLSDASLINADLRHADLNGMRWQQIGSFSGANIYAVRNTPEGFVAWAVRHGAVQIESDEKWEARQSPH